MTRAQAFAAFLALVPLAWGLMWLGWRRRGRSQADLPRPHGVATDRHGTGPDGEGYPGTYVSTTVHGDWLDRVVAHGLGVRSQVVAHVDADGVDLVRTGAPSLRIPRTALVGASRTSGMAGKFVEADGLAVITWVLGSRTLDTGIRLRYSADTAALVAAVAALAGDGSAADGPADDPPGRNS